MASTKEESAQPEFAQGEPHPHREDGIHLILQDHRVAEQLFLRYKECKNRKEKLGVADEIVKEIYLHAAVEEEILYPIVRKLNMAVADRAIKETDEVKKLLAELYQILSHSRETVELEHMDRVVKEIEEDIKKHVAEEERDIIQPLMDDLLSSREQNAKLHELIVEAKKTMRPIPQPEKSMEGKGTPEVQQFIESITAAATAKKV
eukprot:GEZU01042563.1.p1 GENE.GEZU01042563.1~~GEZU01042563.1.p1  ORF type:complete len:205 (-),score=55.74 GEZU01042563.1:86-700(-)